ncbi:hypothetical protein BBOV_III007514 [Babesia bovis T2Bo]|uniref:hypothetical protein n=1 Tax=Babesia bovis T2Bo TaxID=484906 RepID=UPI001C363014|nr:hypothetical protein BBOV_III007514 [Babesia bovis T2Bo]KAG6440015.1 hypothetical protein BBOV_III007514 [Babesia bovis T2Bo]
MADLMHIVDKLREAAAQAKRECDSQIDQALTRMSKKAKDNITAQRDKQLQLRKKAIDNEDKEQLAQKKEIEVNIKQFENLKRSLIGLLETHRTKQKEFNERINDLITKNNRIKLKKDKATADEMAGLRNKLDKKLAQKVNHCKCLMLRDDETLVKIHHMLTGHDT